MQVIDPPEVAPVQFKKPVLQQHSEGADVIELQRLLRHWDAYSSTVDGVFNALVHQAVCAWQHRVFLPENGIVDSLTWLTLYRGGPVDMPVLRQGSHDKPVVIVQKILQNAGIYCHQSNDAAYGEFNTLTEIAVKDFQRRCGLVSDGVVGYYTWRALSKLPH
jgi:peptidoglycan hydrolase-like protein with peptidoglycan-binding domain